MRALGAIVLWCHRGAISVAASPPAAVDADIVLSLSSPAATQSAAVDISTGKSKTRVPLVTPSTSSTLAPAFVFKMNTVHFDLTLDDHMEKHALDDAMWLCPVVAGALSPGANAASSLPQRDGDSFKLKDSATQMPIRASARACCHATAAMQESVQAMLPFVITLMIRDQQGSELLLQLSRATPLQKLMELYCGQMGLQVAAVRFTIEGVCIEPSDMAELLGLENYDIVAVTKGGQQQECG